MNFFEQQDRSKRATRMLVSLFTASVLFTFICIYFAMMLTINTTPLKWAVFGDRACQPIPIQTSSTILPRSIDPITSIPIIASVNRPRQPNHQRSFNALPNRPIPSSFDRSNPPPAQRTPYFSNNYNNYPTHRTSSPTHLPQTGVKCRARMVWWDFRVFFWTLLGTVSIMGGASWWKINQLQAGGAVIASELGGMRVFSEIASPAEQQLLNIVEEMAIAASMAVPPVYILPEDGINAFAAGFTINDAVIGVTRGSLEQLTRDELQGVIAHEFSHILNGDMAMNIRLMGMLNGILFLHITGRVLSYTGWSRDNPFWVFGMLLRVIGFSGFISGRLIQSAISRQREFLADASAVQFTRNADGIAGALEKIGGFSSYIESPYAETTSHMFFSPALNFSWLEGLFATHPPLEQRIQIVRGTGKKLGTRIVVNGQAVPTLKPIEPIGMLGFSTSQTTSSESSTADISASVPATSSIYGALAYTYTLLLDRSKAVEQLAHLAQLEEPSVIEQINLLRSSIDILPPHQRLSTLDRQLVMLRDTEHSARLVKCAYSMVELLPPTNWHSAFIYLNINHRLAPRNTPQEIYHSVEDVCAEMINILGTLAELSCDRPQDVEYAFQAALFRLPSALTKGVTLPSKLHWREFQLDISKIAAAAPKVKQTLISACIEILTNQRKLPPDGADLIRVISILLDCPIPALVDRLSTPQRIYSTSGYDEAH